MLILISQNYIKKQLIMLIYFTVLIKSKMIEFEKFLSSYKLD